MTQLSIDTAPPGYYDEGYAPIESATPKGRVREYIPASALKDKRDELISPTPSPSSASSRSARSSRSLLCPSGPPRSPSSRYNMKKYPSPAVPAVPSSPAPHPGALVAVCPAGLHDYSFSRRKSALLVGLCVASPAIGIVATICARKNIRCTRCGTRRSDEGLAQYGHVEYGAITPPPAAPPAQERKKMALAPGPVVVVGAPARGLACAGQRKCRKW